VSRSPHVPARTCIGCGERAAQAELLRIVSAADGALTVDLSRRAGGRGGYLHRAPGCWEQFRRRKGMVRSLARTVPKPARERLVAQLRLAAGG
jgi:predicted RNA-binding protein YlxR (DUF448 family)